MTAHPDAPVLVCAGRSADDHGRPAGERCGRSITLRTTWDAPGPAGMAELVQVARAAGWAVSDRLPGGGRDVLCPACRRPSPELTKLIKELNR